MSATRHIFAPGKLFVFGEWAVLEGGDALLLPVKYGQEGTLSVSAASTPTFVFRSPGYFQGERVWTWEDGWIEEKQGTSEFDIMAALMDLASHRLTPAPLRFELEVEAKGLNLDGAKVGFGSSGAIAALGAKALVAMSANVSPEVVLELAMDAHHAAQNGRGSGADVAVSVLGSPLIFQLPIAPGVGGTSRRPLRPNLDRAQGHSWPIFAAFSGKSANTRTLMSEVARFASTSPREYREVIDLMGKCATSGIMAWQSDDLRALQQAWTTYGELVADLGECAGVALRLPEHEQIQALAEEHGCVAKTSGAGGGDASLILAPTNSHAQAAWDAICAAGFSCFELQ